MWLLLPLVSLAFCTGAALAVATGAGTGWPVVVACLLPTLAVLSRVPNAPLRSIGLVAFALACGAWRGATAPTPHAPPGWDAAEVLIVGDVVGGARPAWGRGTLIVRARAVRADGRWQPCDARVVVRDAPSTWVAVRGERVLVRGAPSIPSPAWHAEAFDSARWARSRGIAGILTARGELVRVSAATGPVVAIDRLRVRIERALLTRVEGDAAGVLVAMITGSRAALDGRLRDRFAATGAAHVLAVSGLHLGLLLAAAFRVITLALSRWHALVVRYDARAAAAVVSLPLVASYVLLTGCPASAVRAGLMASVMLLGAVMGRPASALHGLAVSCWAMVAVNPWWLADAGFQLSVTATAGLVLAGMVDRGAARSAVWAPLRALGASLRASTVASFATTPVLLWHFGQTPLAAPLTNLLVVPPLALVALPLGTLGALGCAAGLPGADLLVAVAARAVDLSLAVDRLAGDHLTVALTWGRPGMVGLFGWSVLALASPWFVWRHRRAALLWTAVAGALIVPDMPASLRSDGRLRLTVIPVERGTSTLIELPDGTTLLVDGAAGGRFAGDIGARDVVPWLRARGIGRVDVVVATAPDARRIGGLPSIMRALRPSELWVVEAADRRQPLRGVIASAQRMGVAVRRFEQAERAELDGVEVTAFLDRDDRLVVVACLGERCVVAPGGPDEGTVATDGERWFLGRTPGATPRAASPRSTGSSD